MLQLTSLLLISVLTASQVERPPYETAYQKAQEEHKPLLIVVGAEWCAACKILKAQTIDPMQSSGKLQDVVVTVLDKDERPELAQQLMQGSSLPQLIVFAKGGRWLEKVFAQRAAKRKSGFKSFWRRLVSRPRLEPLQSFGPSISQR